MRSIELILQDPSVETRPPCSDVEVDALEGQFSVSIPKVLRDFWKLSNGAVMKDHYANILSVSDVSELLSGGFGEWLQGAGFLPLLYDHESNYVCVALGIHFSPRVIYVLHDDSLKLLYRDLDSFYRGCTELLSSSDFARHFFDAADGDFGPDSGRTASDLEAAKSLMQSGEDWDRDLAIQLLDGNSIDAWRELLNGDRFSRCEAIKRLSTMSSTFAMQILKSDSLEFTEFASSVCQALEHACINFDYKGGHVRIGERWFDLNAFFGRRHIDHAIARLLDWFDDVRNAKSPTKRVGHYMED